MHKRFLTALAAFALSAFAAGCSGDNTTTNSANANTNANVSTNTTSTTTASSTTTTTGEETRVLPDGSEVRTETVDGVKTETRTFKDTNSRVERVVVRTDTSGKRTARVHYRAGEVRELPEGDVERALTATGDALADAGGAIVDKSKEVGGAVADKTKDAAGAVKDKGGDVIGATGDAACTGAEKTADGARAAGRGAKNIGEKVVDTTKEGAKKTAEGAKKVGNTVKNAVTP